jgi:hypothetical protein
MIEEITACYKCISHLLEGPVQEGSFLKGDIWTICSGNSERCCRWLGDTVRVLSVLLSCR